MLAFGVFALLATATSATYVRVASVDNTSFLEQFDFFTDTDPTNGYVDFVNETVALSTGLVRLGGGQIILAAETTDTSSPRRTVRVQSKRIYTQGIFLIDLEHVPTGCGTWPAFWSSGPNWPDAGEIDILEGCHDDVNDQTTLHTNDGCDMSGVNATAFTGSWGKTTDGSANATNCYIKAPNQYDNTGCGIVDNSAQSFGAPFNANKGGNVAAVWDNEGVRVFRWPRGTAPADVSNRTTPQPSSWGVPVARFDFGASCDSTHFHDHQIIFDNTLCGDWAGNTFNMACSAVASGLTCEQFVSVGANMAEAYFVVNYVEVWQDNALTSVKMAADGGERFHAATPRPRRAKQPPSATEAVVEHLAYDSGMVEELAVA